MEKMPIISTCNNSNCDKHKSCLRYGLYEIGCIQNVNFRAICTYFNKYKYYEGIKKDDNKLLTK